MPTGGMIAFIVKPQKQFPNTTIPNNHDASLAWLYRFDRGSGKLDKSIYDRSLGLSCRCVQD